jgi:hypothetical protein
LRREQQAIHACPLWAKVNPQQRLRALRIALPRDYPKGEKLPAQSLGDRVAWIVVEGELFQDNYVLGPGALVYPEALLTDRPLPDKEGLAVAETDLRLLAVRSDDFRELCEDDPELGEALLGALANELSARKPGRRTGKIVIQGDAEPGGSTDPGSELTPPTGTPVPPRTKSNTDRGLQTVGRAPGEPSAEPPERPSASRLNARGSAPLIAPPTEVAGEVDRAVGELESAKRLEPADDEDAEIVVEPDRSEPEISIVALESEAAARASTAESEPVIEPLVAADSGPHHPRPRRQTDVPD